jgi:hypothetical protein
MSENLQDAEQRLEMLGLTLDALVKVGWDRHGGAMIRRHSHHATFALSSSSSNSGMPEAARVASGPGEMA